MILPILPTSVVYAVERYKFQAVLIYGMLAAMLVLPLLGLAGHAQAAQSYTSAYQQPVYPVVNKLQLPAAEAAAINTAPGTAIWPIHGIVTLEFGASDAPFQASHTGIDISSARAAGVTPVAAFREGTVIQVVHSSVSYGNHVVIDHGNGLTSLYGHLAATSVVVGQHVQAGDIVGYEGSTGASTGPHVHFETAVNGTPVNPRRFVSGNP